VTTRTVETVVTNADKPPCRTAAQMTQLCCEKTAALQCCEEVVNAWPGYTAKEIIDHLGLVLDDQGRDKDGRYVNIQMQPRKTPCGEQVTKYDTSQKNCCEGVAVLAWNMTVTPDVLPHDRSIIIAWSGSDGRQVEVITTSNATWFSDGRKTALGHGNSIELFAGATFCGSTAVTVRDGCSTAVIMIRSDLGQWVQETTTGCAAGGGELTSVGNGWYEKISGNIKFQEHTAVNSWEGSCIYTFENNPATGISCVAETMQQYYEDRRPSGYIMDTCFDYPWASYPPLGWVSTRGTLADGGLIWRLNSGCDISCSNVSGATSRTQASVRRTDGLLLYRWSC
jgi:hypothetical protein